jgi:hypothetical protein
LFCMGVKPGITPREELRGCLGTGCLGEYLDQRGIKWQEVGENCIMRSSIVCTFHQILLVW